MKERPILFSAPMVRAILDGRKTQTRRVVQSQARNMQRAGMEVIKWRAPGDPWYRDHVWSMRGPTGVWGDYTHERFLSMCPYGQPGDRLWVRETWGLHLYGDFTCWNRDSIASRDADNVLGSWQVAYKADAQSPYDHWRPSIHMPRWASRIALEVTGVRVERLQRISEVDARAEGLVYSDRADDRGWHVAGERGRHNAPSHAFRALWESINGPASWAANPWVWVVEFRMVQP